MNKTETAISGHEIGTLELMDGYVSHYRLWGPASGKDVVIMLHGGMSHAEWQAPLAEAIRSRSDISFVATDRRGCGLNKVDRGDLKSSDIMFDDVVRHAAFFKKSFDNVHLAGWCQGSQFAVPAARQIRDRNILSSLILVTPGFFWSERFSAMQTIATQYLFAFLEEFKLELDPRKSFLPIPMVPRDFTSIQKWLDYIERDELKTTRVCLNTAGIMEFAKNKSAADILEIDIPIFLALAERDRIVDSRKVEDHLKGVLGKCRQSRTVRYDTEHAVHFEKAEDLAGEIAEFVGVLDSRPKV
jgi:pimeloyl-ACP methyl ester carboxylesterase